MIKKRNARLKNREKNSVCSSSHGDAKCVCKYSGGIVKEVDIAFKRLEGEKTEHEEPELVAVSMSGYYLT